MLSLAMIAGSFPAMALADELPGEVIVEVVEEESAEPDEPEEAEVAEEIAEESSEEWKAISGC